MFKFERAQAIIIHIYKKVPQCRSGGKCVRHGGVHGPHDLLRLRLNHNYEHWRPPRFILVRLPNFRSRLLPINVTYL